MGSKVLFQRQLQQAIRSINSAIDELDRIAEKRNREMKRSPSAGSSDTRALAGLLDDAEMKLNQAITRIQNATFD